MVIMSSRVTEFESDADGEVDEADSADDNSLPTNTTTTTTAAYS